MSPLRAPGSATDPAVTRLEMADGVAPFQAGPSTSPSDLGSEETEKVGLEVTGNSLWKRGGLLAGVSAEAGAGNGAATSLDGELGVSREDQDCGWPHQLSGDPVTSPC